MTSWGGDEEEMGNQDLSVDEAEQLLEGRAPAGRSDLAALAGDLATLASAGGVVDPDEVRRWASLAASTTPLTPTDNGDPVATPASNANRPALQASGLPKRRIPVFTPFLAFFATTAGKVVAAGALAAATTTGGLAATGNLPDLSGDDPSVVALGDDDECEALDDGTSEGEVAEDACEALEAAEAECEALDDGTPEGEAAEDECEEALDAAEEDDDSDEIEADEDDVETEGDDEADEVDDVETEVEDDADVDTETDDDAEVDSDEDDVTEPEVGSDDGDDADDADDESGADGDDAEVGTDELDDDGGSEDD